MVFLLSKHIFWYNLYLGIFIRGVMTIITKRVLLAWVLLFVFIISPAYGETSNNNLAEWEIVNYDDRTITETVTIKGDITFDVSEWDKTETDGFTKLTRKLENWESYNELTDRLPIHAQVKNYVLWKKTALIVTSSKSNDKSVYAQLKDMPGISLSISVPAFITETSGKKVNEMTTVWDSKQINNFSEGQIILKNIALEGFLIGVIGFLLGLIIIGIIFIRRIKKIERIMEAEYSLENISLDEKEEAENNEDEEESRWI